MAELREVRLAESDGVGEHFAVGLDRFEHRGAPKRKLDLRGIEHLQHNDVVPAVPQMYSPPPFALQNSRPGVVRQVKPPKQVIKPERRPAFSDRVARCLEEGAALGLGPNRRAAYSRACVNQ